ncbi:MAG: hypothetical protein DRP82_00370 [Planctomycetota bacterium]|nr:MAG: hypothetical protein DRP82_00370 [Planctomycetota bacterium]
MRRAKRWFGDFLKPEKSEESAGEKGKETREETSVKPSRAFWQWFLFGVVCVLCVVFVFLWVMGRREVVEAEGRANALADVAGALFEGDYAALRESLGRARGLGVPTNVGKLLNRIDAASVSRTAFARHFLAVAKQQLPKAEVKKVFFADLENMVRERLRNADSATLKRLIGQKHIKPLLKELLHSCDTADIEKALGERVNDLIRARLEKLPDERAVAAIGPRFKKLVNFVLEEAASNYALLSQILPPKTCQTLAETLLANKSVEELAPLLEERLEKLTVAVKKWRRKNRVLVVLKDGKTVEGVLIKMTKNEITIRKDDGKKQTIPLDFVKEMKKGAE